MLSRVIETVSRYSMFEPGHRVGAAVSGGADSVCLLHVLHEIAPRWGLRLSVLHVDHGLRGEESRADAAFVRDLAAAYGLPFHLRQVDLAGCAENLEQAARNARQAFFSEFLHDGTLDRVATGHTRSDQAETVLYRFLRGSGSAGLSGIRPAMDDGLVRPLLGLMREEVRKYLNTKCLLWREDSSNQSAAFARNRIRHKLLPQLARDWNPAIAATLAQTAEWAQDEDEYWREETARLAGQIWRERDGKVFIPLDTFGSLRRAVQRRIIRRAIEVVKGGLRQIDFGHVEQVLQLCASREGSGRIQLPGTDVLRSFDWVRFAMAGADNNLERDYAIRLTPGKETRIPGENSVLVLHEIDDGDVTVSSGYNVIRGDELDLSLIGSSLVLRNWNPGDRYQPSGEASEQRIKILFQKARIPLWERRNWPIIANGTEILWTRKFGAARRYAAGPKTQKRLRICERNSSES